MNLEHELNKIDAFFNQMSIEEFDNTLEMCGINEIESAESYGMKIHENEEINVEIEVNEKLNIYSKRSLKKIILLDTLYKNNEHLPLAV